MTEILRLSLNDFAITFKISSRSNDTNIKFYLSFFNRFPELVNDNCSEELHELFTKLFQKSEHLFQLQDNAQKFVTIINNVNLSNVPKAYQELLKEESILYIHASARVIFDFVFETTNQDIFLIVDNLVNKINHIFDFDEYIIPWYDYTQEKLEALDFELSKMDSEDSDKKFVDYFQSILNNQLNLIHRTTDKISIEDDYILQNLLAQSYFKSLPEEQNMIFYLLQKIMKENNTSAFEIHSFIPINEEYAVNFILTAKLVDNELVFGEKNHLFFHLIVKALGAYFSRTKKDSNLFIRAINPTIDIMSYNKDMTKETHKFNEIYGFFFNDDFAYGLTKAETKKILEQDLYTLKYKKPKPGTFYSEAADLFSQYATDKAISLILGNIKLIHK